MLVPCTVHVTSCIPPASRPRYNPFNRVSFAWIFFLARYEDRRVSNHKLVTINFLHCCCFSNTEKWHFVYQTRTDFSTFLGLNKFPNKKLEVCQQTWSEKFQNTTKFHLPTCTGYGVGIPHNFCKWFHSFRTLCVCPPQWQYHFYAQRDHSKQPFVFVSRAGSCLSSVFIRISLKTIQGRTVMGRCICRSFSLGWRSG